jgi:phosphate uptake regulator
MKRKVIKQANQAYTLTLPIEWVRKNNITESSELEVDMIDKSLIIRNTKGVEIKKKVLKIEKMNSRALSRMIKAIYSKGIDELEIICGEEISPEIYSALSETMGFALVSHEKNSYVIKDVGGTNSAELDEVFKRVFQMILLFYDSAIKDVFGKEKEEINNLNNRDLEINKFCCYLQRAISKMSYPDPINGRVLFAFSFALEKIGDEIHRLWRTNIKYKVKKTPALKELVELSNKGLGLSFDLYYQMNSNIAEQIYRTREEVREKSMNLLKLDPHTARFVRHAVKIVEDVADLSHLTFIKNL